MRTILLILIISFSTIYEILAQENANNANRQRAPQQMTNIVNPVAHDPVLIKEGKRYYLFTTGFGVSIMSSYDLTLWDIEPPVFSEPPKWAIAAIPNFRGHIWAPDVLYYQGRYHVFYSCSAFGKNTSAIGHASTKTLDKNSADYGWHDAGLIVQSIPARDSWNAIDANVIVDDEGTPWMNFGSFWDGIKMVRLTPDSLKIAEPQEWYSLIRRKTDDNAVEAPFIYKKGNYYYLFASIDYCCRGLKSDYKVIVGRAEKVTGPYIDQDGVRLDNGGGTVILQGNEAWAGVGHCGVHNIDGKDIFVAHAYVKAENGASKLVIATVEWENDFPKIKMIMNAG